MLEIRRNSAKRLSTNDFRVGEWIVSPERNQIRRRNEKEWRAVEPLLIRFLTALASKPGRTLTKDELIDSVWDGIIVSDEALAQAASRLRKVLSDDPRRPEYVATVRKQGYRLAQPSEDWIEARRATLSMVLPVALTAGVIAAALFLLIDRGSRQRSLELVPVATDAQDETRPALSPDGKQIAFSVVDSAGAKSVWISSGRSGDAILVPGTAGAEAPIWLSNRTLAMQRKSQSGCQILAVDVGYQGIRQIGRCDGSGYADLAVSPDGRQLSFNAAPRVSNSPRAIQIMEIGGSVRQASHPPAGIWGDYDPKFSPDGKSIVFTRATSEGQQDLYMIAPDGRERRLTRRFGNIFGSNWADQRTIVYSARSGGRFGLRQLDLKTGSDRALVLPLADPVNPVVQGSTLLVESRRFHLNMVSTKKVPLPNSSGLNVHPALSPDGRQLIFSSDRNGSLELWHFDRTTKRLKPLTKESGPFVGVPRISPDGRTVAYEVRDRDDAEIRLLDLRTGKSNSLVTGKGFDTAPSFSADGRWVVFGSNREGAWAIYQISVKGGLAKRVLPNAFAAIESPDGKNLYFTRRSEPGLFRLEWSSGRIVTVDTSFRIEDWGAFLPVRGGVLMVERQGAKSRIVFRPISGDDRLIVAPSAPIPAHDPILAALPDLSEVIYVESDLGSGDIYRARR